MHDNKKPNKVERPISANMFSWLEKENSTRNIIYLLGADCAFLFAFDFVYNRYGHFTIEELPGFYAVYGFVMFSLIILLATLLRFFLGRNEDYYGNKAIDSETPKKADKKGST